MKADEILCAAIDLPTQEERHAFLSRACGSDLALRASVEALLRAHEAAGDFLLRPAFTPSSPPAPSPSPGSPVGPYRLVRPLGEGGMGVVWLAEQENPVRRTVALKMIRPELVSPWLVARFEAERQSLARMDHPNIARVFDAGTRGECPYYVMELVDGEPITHYCDGRRLSVRARIALFVAVCRGVQHAHEKGVVHRDLKPSNILVTTYDGRPVPKVIDFGVAKSSLDRRPDGVLRTVFGQMVGTVEYMSPEQARLDHASVDTRSDVYSLGVLLYELLTGTTPLERSRVEAEGVVEGLRVIREEDAPLPSARVAGGPTYASVAAQRGTTPPRLVRRLRRDLDWIAAKCLEKDRERRYESASALASDLERYLAHEAVTVGPPSSWYRVGKLVRRHPGGAAAALLGFLLLAGGVGWAFRLQQDRADRAVRMGRLEREVAAALAEAVAEGARAEDLTGDLVRWEAASTAALSSVRRAESLAAQGAEDVDEALLRSIRDTRSRVEADARDVRLLTRMEEFLVLRGAVDPQRNRFRGTVPAESVREAFHAWGLEWGRPPTPDVVARLAGRPARVRDALLSAIYLAFTIEERADGARIDAWFDTLIRQIESDPWRLAVLRAIRAHDGSALAGLVASLDASRQPASILLVAAGRDDVDPDGPVAKARRALLEKAQRAHPADFWLNESLAYAYHHDRPPRLEEAIRYYTAALALRPGNPGVWLNLGEALRSKTPPDLEGSVIAYERAVALDPAYVAARRGLAYALAARNDGRRAREAFRSWVAAAPDDPGAAFALACALRDGGERNEGIEWVRRAIALDPRVADYHDYLGQMLADAGDPAAAAEACRQAIALDPRHLAAHLHLAFALEDLGDLAGAEAAHRETVALDPARAGSHSNLGLCLRMRGDMKGATDALRRAVELAPKDAATCRNLGLVLMDSFDAKGAIDALERAMGIDPGNVPAARDLARALASAGRIEEAMSLLGRVARTLPAADPRRSELEAQASELQFFARVRERLPDAIAGRVWPLDPSEQEALICACHLDGAYATGARLAERRLAGPPPPTDSTLLFSALCAAQAGLGHGTDAAGVQEEERARWRNIAVEWLQAYARFWARYAKEMPPSQRWCGRVKLRQLQIDPQLADYREPSSPQRLPESERAGWAHFWAALAEDI